MNLPPISQKFVLHFGEMGSRWGINRTVGQIYALLYLSEQPMNADEIAEKLSFSRSNVSMGLKELQAWNLIKLQHIPGDRRDYFSPPLDIWEIFSTLAQERRKREIEPTLTLLRDILLENAHNKEENHAQNKMREMYDLIELVTRWFSDMQKIPTQDLVYLMGLGSKIQKIIETKNKLVAPFKIKKTKKSTLTKDPSDLERS
jgi:DNA-binding transcriptional regulator GbsR (MarR family)